MLNDKRIQTEECAYSGKEQATGKFKSMTESQMWLAKGRSKAQRTPECQPVYVKFQRANT